MRVSAIFVVFCMAAAFLCALAPPCGHGFSTVPSDQSTASEIPAPAQGDSASGLRISIQPDKPQFTSGEKMTFHVEFRNSGAADLVLNLGMMLANGKKQYPTAVTLMLADASGQKRKLQLTGPPGVGGRIDDLIVPLPVNAAYALELPLGDYWCFETKEWRFQPAPGQYTITAVYHGEAPHYINTGMEGIRLISVVTGEVASETTDFSVVAG